MKIPLILAAAFALAPAAFAVEYTVFRVCEDKHVIRTSDGQEAGHVEYLVVDPESQRIVSTVVSGGVVGEKFIAVPYESMRFGTGREVTLTRITRERLISAPVIERRILTSNVMEPAVFQRTTQHFSVHSEPNAGFELGRPGTPADGRPPRPGEPIPSTIRDGRVETRIVMPGSPAGNPPGADSARPGQPGSSPAQPGQSAQNPARPGQPGAPNNAPSTAPAPGAQPGQNARLDAVTPPQPGAGNPAGGKAQMPPAPDAAATTRPDQPAGKPADAQPASAKPDGTQPKSESPARPGTKPASAENPDRPAKDAQAAKPNRPAGKADSAEPERPAKGDQPGRNRKGADSEKPAGEKREAGEAKPMRDRPSAERNSDKPRDGEKPKVSSEGDRTGPGKGARKAEQTLEKAGGKADEVRGKMKGKGEGEGAKAPEGRENPRQLPDPEKKKDRQ